MRTNFNLIYKTYKSIKILRNAAILLFSVSQTRYTANHENISKPYNNPKANYTMKEKLDLKPCSNNYKDCESWTKIDQEHWHFLWQSLTGQEIVQQLGTKLELDSRFPRAGRYYQLETPVFEQRMPLKQDHICDDQSH